MPKARKEVGYEVCAHICPGRECISPITRSILWRKEGNSCQRHCSSTQKHPECLTSGVCPQSSCIGRKFILNAAGVREPTDAELATLAALSIPLQSRSGTPMSTSDTNISSSFVFTMPLRNRVFNIIFILDPTTFIASKAAACNDLAFVTTTISNDEFQTVSHLNGYVHPLKRTLQNQTVCIQEWVSILF